MKRLCYGTIALTLRHCAPQSTLQQALHKAMMSAIEPWDDKRESSQASRLFKCEINPAQDICDAAKTIDHLSVSAHFEKQVVPLLDPNKRKNAVLALIEIVREDDTIDEDTVLIKQGSITKELLCIADAINIADFLSGLFLYAVAYVANKEGAGCIEEITPEFISSFDSQKPGFSITQTQLTLPEPPVAWHTRLLRECGGICACGEPLGLGKKGGGFDACHFVYLPRENPEHPTIDDAIALCPSCSSWYLVASQEDRQALRNQKKRMTARTLAGDNVSGIKIDEQIAEVLLSIQQFELKDEDLAEAQRTFEPSTIKAKIRDIPLRRRTTSYVTEYYPYVQKLLQSIGRGTDLETIAQQFHLQYLKARNCLRAESDIADLLAENLYNHTGQRYSVACQIIVAYFIQSCEVFKSNAVPQ
jgi:hypothetical protein